MTAPEGDSPHADDPHAVPNRIQAPDHLSLVETELEKLKSELYETDVEVSCRIDCLEATLGMQGVQS